jgi:hypothetical protein
MRAWNKQPSEEIRERYLGEIAPLLEAARQVESLAPEQKRQVRRRIVRTLFGTRHLGFRARLAPALVALALLAIGGAAFATAQRLGLLPGLGHNKASEPAGQSEQEARKHKAVRGRAASHPAAVVVDPTGAGAELATEQTRVLLPEVPDPLLYPLSQASTSVWAPWPQSQPPPAGVRVAVLRATPAPAATTKTSARAAWQGAPARPWPAPSAQPMPAVSPATPSAVVNPTLGVRSPEAAATSPAVAPLAVPAASAPPPVPAPPAAQPAAAPPPAAQTAPAQKSASSDRALFGQAIRRLRTENNPSAALVALHEHAKAYPRSALGGERTALEVEALLALHRDRDALALLDTMALDELPRSGERFVVRGELRAAARRWQEACADFERALARVSGSPAWHERALWGRGVARLHLGEREAGLDDMEHYLDGYPKGRFAAEAAKLFPRK